MDHPQGLVTEAYEDVRAWSERNQRVNGDHLKPGYKSKVSERVEITFAHNELGFLRDIWNRWDDSERGLFIQRYGDIALLLYVQTDESLLRAAVHFWNPAYRCFTFNQEDLVPTVEEYTALVNTKGIKFDKIYSKSSKPPAFKRRLAGIMDVQESWVEAHKVKKGNSECVAWDSIRSVMVRMEDRDRIRDVFALAIYGLIIFPKVPGHIEVAVVDLFSKLGCGINPAPAILAETIRSLSHCKQEGSGRFIGCTPLLYIWLRSHFWVETKRLLCPYMDHFSPITKFLEKKWEPDMTQDQWIQKFRNIQSEEIVWRVPWIVPSSFVYKCGDFEWVPLIGIWGGVGYAPLMALRQFECVQFIPVTRNLDDWNFDYRSTSYSGKVQSAFKAWKQTYCFTLQRANNRVTPGYEEWRVRRINDILISSNDGPSRIPVKEIPSEAELLTKEFSQERVKLQQEIARLKEEKSNMELEFMIQEGKMKRIVQERDIANERLQNLHEEHKALLLSRKYRGVGKSPAEWKAELAALTNEVDSCKARAQTFEQNFTKAQAALLVARKKCERLEAKTHLRGNERAENEVLHLRIQELERTLQSANIQVESVQEKEREQHHAWYESDRVRLELQERLRHFKKQILHAQLKADDMVDEARFLRQTYVPIGEHGQEMINYLEDVIRQCNRLRYFQI